MLEQLKLNVFNANISLVKYGLVIFTWGNVSGISRKDGLVVIKPSGMSYDTMNEKDMVVTDLNGKVMEGNLRPSSDLATHIELYKAFPEIGGVVHTHSEWATSWAQACRSIPAYGTTHADNFYGELPCTRQLTKDEVEGEYEKNTGLVITECFETLDPMAVPGVLVAGHGPFTWGKNPEDAVKNSVIAEELAKMAFRTQVLGNDKIIDEFLLNKHYNRKHGKNAYYGQK